MGYSVSVIIPTYNRARLLPEAIDSALGQTLPPLEVIVVDDGSTDDTARVVARFGERVVYLHQPNAGPATARNNGVRRARGDLVALLDSDDRWLPRKLEVQLPLFADPGVGVVYGGFRCFGGGSGAIVPDYFAGHSIGFHDLLGFKALGTQTLVFRRAAFDAAGGFDESCSPAEDQDFTIRLAARVGLRGVAETVTEVRLHDGQISGDKQRMFRASMHVLRKNEQTHPADCPGCRQALARARRTIHTFYYHDLNRRARVAALHGNVVRAVGLGLKALWVDPGALTRFPGKLLGQR